jgi:hypothetical protein
MKKHGIVVAALVSGLALSLPAFAQGGQGKGQGIQNKPKTMIQMKEQKRLRDGSCTQSGNPTGQKAKKGKAYGPGDGTGYQVEGPKDGTGYGAPTNR